MLFSFKVTINTDLCKYKNSIKDKLDCEELVEMYKVAFLGKLAFIWCLGNFELTAENHQGKNFYRRRHILSVVFFKKKENKTLLKGINLVNLFDYLAWFLIPFVFAIIDGDLLWATLISVFVVIISMLIGFDKDKRFSELLVRKFNDDNE